MVQQGYETLSRLSRMSLIRVDRQRVGTRLPQGVEDEDREQGLTGVVKTYVQ